MLAFGFVVSRPSVGETPNQEAEYNPLYPYAIELCAVSQVRPLEDLEGGPHGHAVMYLNGACRVEDAPYPQIEVCQDDVDLTDPDAGVGISVDKMFKSVNWAAVPGRRLFIHGDLDEGDLLNQEHADRVIQKAVQLGLFRGVEFHEEYVQSKPADKSMEEHVAAKSLSTNYALKFGRSVFCASLPVTKPILQRAVDYLNELNAEYASGEADYNWSGYYDNCAHTVHNSLAAAGLWKSKSVNTFKIRQFFHVAVPANEFVDLAKLVTDDDLESFRKIYKDKITRQNLLEDHWLPMRHGALLRSISVHQNNELYNKEFSLYVLQGPFFKRKSRYVEKLLWEKRNTHIEENLVYYQERYSAILAKQGKGRDKAVRKGSRAEAKQLYYQYIEDQLKDVSAKLQQLNSGS